jgi:2'-5' RNA ligase
VRAFIAVDLTPEIRERIAEIQSLLGRFSHAVRWVRPESIHVTLKFLGEISAAQQQQIVGIFSAHKSGVTPFRIRVQGIGFFPDARRPRVVWLGIDEGQESLQSLAQFVEEQTKSAGFPSEERPFSSHVTIGRIKFMPDAKAFSEATVRFKEHGCGIAEVRQFFLYESQLNRSGAIYTKRATFELE